MNEHAEIQILLRILLISQVSASTANSNDITSARNDTRTTTPTYPG
jgi:hypothetical protein